MIKLPKGSDETREVSYELHKYFKHIRQFMKCFKNDTSHMDVSSKIDHINNLIVADKWHHKTYDKEGKTLNKYSILTESTLKTIYFHVLLDNQSLFFYKCIDPIYLLEFFGMKA